ncbi:hypothetical protein D1869_04760 [Sulfurisphaera ohwakuensis]|uniref:Uncharacterized protein n=1 Tax=Sulfurisphaera ohwakuensis TaxID=69656 RepID=A0A650CFE5_SULOH|nr:hypothetical protein [Sulfurisphaera ohwakuensis]QGR16581.1 hypothetical protein D1869_04760 [Sulfurisphaera ohwakuensis]
MMLMTLFPSSMGLREGQLSFLFSLSRDSDNMDDGSPTLILGWVSAPPDCPPNERCNPESMVGTMNPLEGNPRPFQGGELPV